MSATVSPARAAHPHAVAGGHDHPADHPLSVQEGVVLAHVLENDLAPGLEEAAMGAGDARHLAVQAQPAAPLRGSGADDEGLVRDRPGKVP
jgi:hypothetical protein